MKNNKGFTLLEIIAVIVILGIIVVISGVSVINYIDDSKQKTYKSYVRDLRVASQNYMNDCMSNNEDNCDIPFLGETLELSYDYLINNGYTSELKDPEGDNYCDRSYVIVKNDSNDVKNIEYYVCLYCSKYNIEEEGCIKK